MARFFSPATSGFYDDAINAALPSDVMEISAAEHAALFAAQAQGQTIAPGPDGRPRANRPRLRLAERRAAVVSEIKSEAARRIEAIAPSWRQANDLALMLRAMVPPTLSDGDAATLAAAQARRAAIDAIRARSTALEAEVARIGGPLLAAFDPRSDTRWS